MNSNELIEKIKNDFKSLEDISLSELNIAVASPSRKAIEHNFFYISTIENQKKRTFFGKNLLSECKDLINFEVIDSNYKNLDKQISELKEENKRLKENISVKKAKIKNLKEGISVIEEKARYELGLIKEKETFYQIIK